MFFKKKLGVG